MRIAKRARDNLMEQRKRKFIGQFGECPKKGINGGWFTYNPPECGYPYFGTDQYGKAFKTFTSDDALKRIGLL